MFPKTLYTHCKGKNINVFARVLKPIYDTWSCIQYVLLTGFAIPIMNATVLYIFAFVLLFCIESIGLICVFCIYKLFYRKYIYIFNYRCCSWKWILTLRRMWQGVHWIIFARALWISCLRQMQVWKLLVLALNIIYTIGQYKTVYII